MVFILFLAAIFSHAAFYAITAVLSVVTLSWSANLSLSIVVGTWKMRRACGVDWHARLQELEKTLPEGEANSSHIVILPNYKENEDMLLETLENLGRSPLARSSLRVVLAMEEREGPEGHEKAERLVAKAEHLFAGIIAAFHPSGLPGELAGKSSNTQWAFQEALRVFTPVLERYDPSKVFITVGDADTLWHAQFLSAVTYQALEMPHEERAWSIWQPPIMLLRNLFSVPALTRVSCYGTIMFELAGVTNQLFGSHMSYSAYTMTLAMATHRLVGGWDKDVIAEDHHMFCKCYCAAIWESVEASLAPQNADEEDVEIKPKVQLRPVFLPAISYLVESDEGWKASMFARFQQARRHSQGVAELSYIILQHVRLFMAAGVSRIPFRTHMGIMAISGKMVMVHVVNMLHSLAVILSVIMLALGAIQWLCNGGLELILSESRGSGIASLIDSKSIGNVVGWSVLAIFGPIPPIGFLMSGCTYVVVRDALEGRLTWAGRSASRTADEGEEVSEESDALVPVAPAIQGSTLAPPGAAAGSIGWLGGIRLYLSIQSDYFNWAELTILGLGFVPVCMAAWSLLRNGTKFEYIVAAKPS